MIRILESIDYSKRNCVIFDFDGTIADTLPYIVDTANKALSEFGMSEEEMGDLRRLVGPSFPQAFSEVYGVSAEDADTITEIYRKIYFELGAKAWPAFDGIEELLAELRAQGKKVCIASSKNDVILTRSLNDNGLFDAFDLVLGRTLDGRGTKEEFIVQAFESFDMTAGDALMIGDRHFDVEAAKLSNIPCVGVSYGGAGSVEELEGAGAACIVDNVGELACLLLGKL